jgi:hypothetical protein
MESSANVPDFFRRPLGADYPKELHDQLKRNSHCTICIGDNNEYIPAKLKVRLDSQQPWLDVQIDKAHVVFPATRTEMKFVIKGTSREYDAFIQARQKYATEWKKDYQACFFELSPSATPVFAGPFWELSHDQSARWSKLQAIEWPGKKVYIWSAFPNKCLDAYRDIQTHMANLVQLVRKNIRTNGKSRSFWYAERNPLAEGEKAPRRPMMPWLFDKNGQYNAWDTSVDFYLDDQDRRSRLVEAAIVERHIEWSTYNDVFCEGKTHDVIFELVGPKGVYWKLHVWMNADPKPAPPEGSRAEYKVNIANSYDQKGPKLIAGDGFCMGSSRADFTILTRAHFDPALDGQTRKIMASLAVNLKPTNLQINALDMAGRTVSFGDSAERNGNGFSLQRTILAQGSELSPKSPFYFELDVKSVSELAPNLQRERIEYIREKYVLDKSQSRAVQMSVFKVIAGIHLVKGPSGNGKTRTTLVMLLILASLGMKVLISGGSNQAVDTLLLAFHEALTRDARLRGWCGIYCRFRTPAYQMGVLRRASMVRRLQERNNPNHSIEEALADFQIEALVVKKAIDFYDEQPEAKQLLDLLDQDRERLLGKDETITLKSCYEKLLRRVVGQCKVVAATLKASGDENLKNEFKPYALLCDEAGQCLEGDSMIPMTGYPSLRTIILIGDPDQLPPTVISLRVNEGAKYYGRSLMSRLSGCYPLTLLEINYRCHPDILDWPASSIYKSKITASYRNTEGERVGNAWDAFTASRHHFNEKRLIGKRRLVIDADGVAEQPPGSTSWRNDAHISVVIAFLRAVYADRSTKDRICPEDVTLICPYKEQVKRVIQRFSAEGTKYNQCLTVDGSQGQEFNVVIFMFTKPRTNSMTEVGLLSSPQRLNVALTRAKKLLIVVVSLRIWNAKFVSAAKAGSSRYLASFLKDAVDKGDVLEWVGRETVERLLDSTQQQKMTTSSRPAPSSQKKEQSTATSSSRSARAVDDELAKATLKMKQLALDKDSMEAEQAALDEKRKEMEATLKMLNAQQDALTARRAQLARDRAAMQLVIDRASKKAA